MRLQLFQSITKIFQNSKTHDFQSLERDADYFVDFQKSGKLATLTTTERIKVGETIILAYDTKPTEYCAEAIDCYWNGNCIKTIWLKKINIYPEKVANQLRNSAPESWA